MFCLELHIYHSAYEILFGRAERACLDSVKCILGNSGEKQCFIELSCNSVNRFIWFVEVFWKFHLFGNRVNSQVRMIGKLL